MSSPLPDLVPAPTPTLPPMWSPHPWRCPASCLSGHAPSSSCPPPLSLSPPPSPLQRLQRFSTYGHLKQIVLKMIVDEISSDGGSSISVKVAPTSGVPPSLAAGLKVRAGEPVGEMAMGRAGEHSGCRGASPVHLYLTLPPLFLLNLPAACSLFTGAVPAAGR